MAAVAEGRGLAADGLLDGGSLGELYLDGLVDLDGLMGECERVVRRSGLSSSGGGRFVSLFESPLWLDFKGMPGKMS